MRTLARRESNPRSGPYKRPALTAELRRHEARLIWPSGAEGSRTLTCPIKSRKCCRYATTPIRGVGVCVSVEWTLHCCSPSFRVVSSKVVRGGVEPPPTTYQIVMLPLQHRTAVGKVGVEPTRLVLPRHAGRRCPTIPMSYAFASSSSYGSRTHLSVLKGRNPRTDRRTSRICASC